MITKKVLLAHICDIYAELDAIEEKLARLAVKPATEGEKKGRGRPKGSKNKAK